MTGSYVFAEPKWVDPPNVHGSRGFGQSTCQALDLLDLLRARPHTWAHIATYRSKSGGGALMRSLCNALGAEIYKRDWIMHSRVRHDPSGLKGKCSDVYAKYIGAVLPPTGTSFGKQVDDILKTSAVKKTSPSKPHSQDLMIRLCSDCDHSMRRHNKEGCAMSTCTCINPAPIS